MSDPGYRPIDDRQVVNRAALPYIGSPANDNLADILSRINSILAGISGGSGYVAQEMALTSGTTSQAITVSAQLDTSYIVLGIMKNTVDAHPQYQQIEVTAKSTSGFTLSWDNPLDTSNYSVYYILPYKVFPEVEAAIGSGADSLSSTLLITQPFSSYGVITQLQNVVDPNPQFQSVVIGTNTDTNVNLSWNNNTDTANYQAVYMVNATGQTSIPISATSVTVTMPVNYGTASYAVVASMQNADAHPQYQPMIITAQTDTTVTFGWNVALDTADYNINFYAISLTP